MTKLTEALDRIGRLECPTGDVEERVAGIFQQYGANPVSVHRAEELDQDGAEAYRAEVQGESVVILATAGMDDYVAKVVDVYTQ